MKYVLFPSNGHLFWIKGSFTILSLFLLLFSLRNSYYLINQVSILMIQQIGQLDINFFDIFATDNEFGANKCLRVDMSRFEMRHDPTIIEHIQRADITSNQAKRFMAYVALYDEDQKMALQNISTRTLPLTQFVLAFANIRHVQCVNLVSALGDVPRIEKFLATGGEHFQTQGQFPLSELFYQAALTLNNNDKQVLDSLLFLYSRSGNEAGEMETLERYLDLDLMPRDSIYYMRLARFEEIKKDWKAAINAYEMACELGELASTCRYRIARLYHTQLKDLKKAQEEYEVVLAVAPTYEAAWQGLNFLFIDQGDFKAASDLLADMKIVLPDSEAPDLYAGWNELIRSRPMEAIPHLLAAVEMNPVNALSFSVLGRAYSDAGILDEAAKAFGEQVRLDPFSSQGMAELAEVKLLMGEEGEACKWVVKSLEINANNALALQMLQDLSEC